MKKYTLIITLLVSVFFLRGAESFQLGYPQIRVSGDIENWYVVGLGDAVLENMIANDLASYLPLGTAAVFSAEINSTPVDQFPLSSYKGVYDESNPANTDDVVTKFEFYFIDENMQVLDVNGFNYQDEASAVGTPLGVNPNSYITSYSKQLAESGGLATWSLFADVLDVKEPGQLFVGDMDSFYLPIEQPRVSPTPIKFQFTQVYTGVTLKENYDWLTPDRSFPNFSTYQVISQNHPDYPPLLPFEELAFAPKMRQSSAIDESKSDFWAIFFCREPKILAIAMLHVYSFNVVRNADN